MPLFRFLYSMVSFNLNKIFSKKSWLQFSYSQAMCLATPVKVLKLNKNKAIVNTLGRKNLVDISLLKNVKVNDYLYASRGLAIKKVSRSDAKKVLELINNWQR